MPLCTIKVCFSSVSRCCMTSTMYCSQNNVDTRAGQSRADSQTPFYIHTCIFRDVRFMITPVFLVTTVFFINIIYNASEQLGFCSTSERLVVFCQGFQRCVLYCISCHGSYNYTAFDCYQESSRLHTCIYQWFVISFQLAM